MTDIYQYVLWPKSRIARSNTFIIPKSAEKTNGACESYSKNQKVTKMCQFCCRKKGGHYLHHLQKSVLPFSNNVISCVCNMVSFMLQNCCYKLIVIKNSIDRYFFTSNSCNFSEYIDESQSNLC